MTSFLARDLLRDQYANLEQAGHGVEDKIPLARVFVDLPVTYERTAEPPKEEKGGKSRVAELVATLVAAARDSLGQTPPMEGMAFWGKVTGHTAKECRMS